jgi:hypothetical protein
MGTREAGTKEAGKRATMGEWTATGTRSMGGPNSGSIE